MESYVIGFKIFDAKALQTEDGKPCDPFVVVSCCGETHQTEILEERQQLASFNESRTWPELRLFPAQFESGSIEFKVYARNWFTRNYLIGQASLQLSYINNRQHHLYARRWLCLRKDGDPAITGMLNVSVFALHPGQPAPSATLQEQEMADGPGEEGEKDDADMLSKAVLKTTMEAPPGKEHYVEINVHRVQDLAVQMSMTGEVFPSPYITVEFAGCLLKTPERESVRNCTFNAKMLIPVVTPVYEDTIILKLWNKPWVGPHELMAQGLISFSELRNNALPPRWFNLYGWNKQEIPDLAKLTDSGVTPEPNYFQGRILVSGRVVPVGEDDELQAATVGVARGVPEPNVRQTAIMGDVYMVIGASGRSCEVELSYGSSSNFSARVNKDKTSSNNDTSAIVESDSDEDGGGHQSNIEVCSFTFKESHGRIDPMLVMSPEDPESQPHVMINVYTFDIMGNRSRIGYCMRSIDDFGYYEAGNPGKPKFFPLTPMPGSRGSASVLMTVERNQHEDMVRHNRKIIKPMMYIVRTYCFMARKIEQNGDDSDTFAIQPSCAGRSRESEFLPGPRPKWMKYLDLQVTLYAESQKSAPVIEPIVLSLIQNWHGSKTEIGAATCVYTLMRQKNNLGSWEPFSLAPQWIQLKGGKYGDQAIGEALIAFELLPFKHKGDESLKPREMWPKPDLKFDRRIHFCRLRKATLHFSLLGLRDLLLIPAIASLGLMPTEVIRPIVEVEVQWGDQLEKKDAPARKKLLFRFRDVVEGGDKRIRADRLCKWTSEVAPGIKASNFEFLQTDKLKVEIPDKRILQPYVIIRVYEEPSSAGGSWIHEKFGQDYSARVGYVNTFLGESRRSLAQFLPCCWFDGISEDKSKDEQKDILKEEIAKATEESRVRPEFVQPSEKELKSMRRQHMQDEDEGKGKSSLQAEFDARQEAVKEYVNSTALPEPLRDVQRRRPLREVGRRTLDHVNVEAQANFGERRGFKFTAIGASMVKTIAGKLEDQGGEDVVFNNDMWYRGYPLLKHHDVVSDADLISRPWEQCADTLGFVKCTFKLVDGWEEDEPEEDDDEDGGASPSRFGAPRLTSGVGSALTPLKESAMALLSGGGGAPKSAEETEDDKKKRAELMLLEMEAKKKHVRIMRSPNVPDELDEFAFDQTKFRKRFKDSERVPARVRVRLYLVKAVCIYGGSAGDFPDPYVEFQLGARECVSMRSNAQIGTNEPNFYMMEERDVVLPEDSKLQITIRDKFGALAFSADPIIGSTIMDLEDRWHSSNWQKMNLRQEVPKENRPLSSREELGVNRGALEMWVEMLDSQRATDLKASPLVKPPEIELEVRLVIWDTKNVKRVKEDYVNVHLATTLDCGEYHGACPKRQETDTHWQSKDGNAIFNYRMVYPRIKMPIKTCSLKMDLYHYETLGTTTIGSLDLDLKKYVERVATNMDAIELPPDMLKFSNPETQDPDNPEDIGSVRAQLYVLTQIEATSKRAGMGREDPNDYPSLITPAEGRDWGTYLSGYAFSLPDMGLWKKMIPLFIIMVIFLFCVIAMRQMGLL